MEPYAKRIAEEATDNVQAIEIIQQAITHYSAAIMEIIKATPEADMPFLIACADTIRAAASANIGPETMKYVDMLKRNIVAVAIQMPGGSDDGRQK